MAVKYLKKDLRTKSDNDYDEYTATKGVDIEFTNGLETLWQTVVGELKTPFGSLGCDTLSNYGSYLYRLIGQKKTPEVIKELEFYIEQVMQTYPMITNWEVKMLDKKRTELNFQLTIYVGSKSNTGSVSIVS